MKLKVLITRKIFDEAIAFVKNHFEVDDNQSYILFPPKTLVKRLHKKAGAIILLTDRIDEAVLSQCPDPKIVSNIAVRYNNDVQACAHHMVMVVTNTPGVLNDTMTDFTWTLLLTTGLKVQILYTDMFLAMPSVEKDLMVRFVDKKNLLTESPI
jgi:lactate dehydrogenase-like 2-hydroxyacid dehydrogenase